MSKAWWIGLVLLGGCASYDGRGLNSGASPDEVQRVMGPPTAVHKLDQGEAWEYVRGPGGFHTYMARMVDGRLQRIDQVLSAQFFDQVRPGMERAEVRRTLGTPYATTDFRRRDEEVWDYRFYNSTFDYVMRFHVVMDKPSGKVKSTLYTTEYPPDPGPSLN